jgi:hypothetical protein
LPRWIRPTPIRESPMWVKLSETWYYRRRGYRAYRGSSRNLRAERQERYSRGSTDPEAIHRALKAYADRLHRVGLEAQSLSPWLYKELSAMGLSVIVVEAVHMQKALSAQRNKTDRGADRTLRGGKWAHGSLQEMVSFTGLGNRHC